MTKYNISFNRVCENTANQPAGTSCAGWAGLNVPHLQRKRVDESVPKIKWSVVCLLLPSVPSVRRGVTDPPARVRPPGQHAAAPPPTGTAATPPTPPHGRHYEPLSK